MALHYGERVIRRTPHATETAPSVTHVYHKPATKDGEAAVIRRRQPSEQPPVVTTKKRATK
jgi:hypothetical protein